MDKQYDMSPEMKKLFEIKHKQRTETKEYYQKLLYNPYRPVKDGIPFDPSLMRFNSLNTYRYQIYETNPRFYFKLMLLLSPFAVIYYGITSHQKQKEDLLRSGVVKYEDRYNKFFF